jgi:hypothetical protein
MAKVYKTAYVIDDSQAQASLKRSLASLLRVEKSSLAAATSIEKVSRKFAESFAAASSAVSSSTGASARAFVGQQVAAVRSVSAANEAAVRRRVKLEADAVPRIAVGLDKLRASGFKLQDDLIKASERRALADQKVADRAAKAAQMQAARDAKAAEKAAARSDAATARDAKDQERRTVMAAKAAEKVSTAEEKEKARLQAVVDRMLKSDYDKRVAYERRKQEAAKKAAVQGLTDVEVTEKAKQRIIVETNRKRVYEAMKAMGYEKKTFTELVKSAGAAALSVSGVGQAMTAAGLAMAAFAGAKVLIDGIADAMQRVKDKAAELGIKLIEEEEALRPLASVMGRKPDLQFARENAAFNVAAGIKPAEGRQFREAFRGRAQIVEDVNISKPELAKFEEQAAKLAASKGMNFELAGELMGGVVKIKDYKSKGQGAKEALHEAATALEILDAGSGKMERLAPELSEILAAVGSEKELEGSVRGTGEGAVLASVGAEFKDAKTSVLVQRTIAGLRDFGKESKGAFFSKTKIAPKDTALEAIGKANKYFEEQIKRTGKPIDQIIMESGFSEEREIRGLSTFFSARNTVLKKQLEKLESSRAPGEVEKTQEKLDETEVTDVGRNQINEAIKHQNELERGVIPAKVKLLRDEAINALNEPGKPGLDSTEVQLGNKFWGAFRYLPAKVGVIDTQEEARITGQMRVQLIKRARDVGLNPEEIAQDITAGYGTKTTEGFNERFAAAIDKIEKAAEVFNAGAGKIKGAAPVPVIAKPAPAPIARP